MQLETKLYNNIWKIYKDKWWEKKMDVIHEINILINVIHVTYERQSLQHSSSPNFTILRFNNHLLYSLGLPPPLSTHRQYPISLGDDILNYTILGGGFYL